MESVKTLVTETAMKLKKITVLLGLISLLSGGKASAFEASGWGPAIVSNSAEIGNTITSVFGDFRSGVPGLIIVKEGILHVSSQCAGEKQVTAAVAIPQDVPQAYSHTKISKSGNGRNSHSLNYSSVSKLVTITAKADTHRECGCIGGICNRPGSDITVKYTVYALTNSCDPTPTLPKIDEVSAVDYEAALQRINQSKECQRMVLQNKRTGQIDLFGETILSKLEKRYGEKKAEAAKDLAKVKELKARLEKVKLETAEFRFLSAELGKKVYDMEKAFHAGFDYASTLNYVSFQLAQYKDWKKEQLDALFADPKNARIKRMLDERREFLGLPINKKAEPLVVTPEFSTEDWLFSLQRHLDSFNYYYDKLSARVRTAKDQSAEIAREDLHLFQGMDVGAEIGLDEIETLLLQYRSKANEMYLKGLENQESLKNIHSLNKKSIDEWLCVSEGQACPIKLVMGTAMKPKLPKFYSAKIPSSRMNEACLTLETAVDYNSDLNALPRTNNENFASINGRPLYFRIDTSSIQYDRGKAIRSRVTSCFHSSLLKMGTNRIELHYRYGDGSLFRGSSSSVLYVNYGKQSQRAICSESRQGSTVGMRGCAGSMTLDLQDLDPVLKKRIVDLQAESRALDLELRKQNQELENLKARLEYYSKIDVDKISSEEVQEISDDLKYVANAMEQLRFRANLDREQVESEIAEMLVPAKGDSVETILNKSYDLSNDRILGPLATPDLKLMESTIEAYTLGGTKEKTTVELQKAYESIKTNIIRELESSVQAQNFKKADQVLSGWKLVREEMYRRMKDRKAGAAELDMFRNLVADMEVGIGKYFDSDGFYNAAQVPMDIKNFVSKGSKAGNQFADEIRIAMNKNIQDRLNAEQKVNQINFYMMMRAYDELLTFETSQDKVNFAPQARKEIEKGLMGMVESGFRIGVSFTPVGKFVDFCELVTGRTLCKLGGEELTTADRALAGLGIFVGSGVVLRKLAKSSIIRDSKAIGLLSEIFVDAAHKMKASFAPATDTVEAIGAKIIRIFGGNKPMPAAEVRAFTDKLQKKFIREYKDSAIISADAENLKFINLGMEAPWQPGTDIAAIRITDKKTLVRVYSGSNMKSSWMTEEKILIGRTPEEIKKVLGIKYVPDKIVKVTVPEGTEVHFGKINRIGKPDMEGMAGAPQYHIPSNNTDTFVYGESRSLGRIFEGIK